MTLVYHDEERLAKFHHESGDVYTIRCKDPHGFWSVSAINTSPRIPLLMQGEFTTADKAVEYIHKALNIMQRQEQNKNKQEPVSTEVVKHKKDK